MEALDSDKYEGYYFKNAQSRMCRIMLNSILECHNTVYNEDVKKFINLGKFNFEFF